MGKICLYALPGFLGVPEDWEGLCLSSSLELRPICLTDFPLTDLGTWARCFNDQVECSSCQQPQVLAGYSLGGRLALHALLERPRLWRQALLISTHPGLAAAEERQARLASDVQWATRFENEPWSKVMEAWNQQAIFQTSRPVDRWEADYARPLLAQQLRHLSIGHQADLRGQIATLPLPLDWIVGEKDDKYLNCMETLSFCHPASRKWILPQVGHRLLAEAAPQLSEIFNSLSTRE